MGIENAKQSFWDCVYRVIQYGFNTYKDFIFGLIIGIVVAWVYHRFVGNKNLRDSYKILIKSKEETIEAYKLLVSEKLDKITVDQKDKAFFKRIKDYFKHSNKKSK